MMKPLTPEEKRMVQRHPIFIEYSGQVPEHLRHLVYPGEAKPEGKKGKAKTSEEPVDNGDGN